MSEERKPIYIKKELYEKIKSFIESQGGFSSVEEFIEFIIDEVLSEDQEYTMSKEDEEKIKERLKALGYL